MISDNNNKPINDTENQALLSNEGFATTELRAPPETILRADTITPKPMKKPVCSCKLCCFLCCGCCCTTTLFLILLSLGIFIFGFAIYPNFCNFSGVVEQIQIYGTDWQRPNTTFTVELYMTPTANKKVVTLPGHTDSNSTTVFRPNKGTIATVPYFNRSVCVVLPVSLYMGSGAFCFNANMFWKYSKVDCPSECGTGKCQRYFIKQQGYYAYRYFTSDGKPCMQQLIKESDGSGSVMLFKSFTEGKPDESKLSWNIPNGCTDLRAQQQNKKFSTNPLLTYDLDYKVSFYDQTRQLFNVLLQWNIKSLIPQKEFFNKILSNSALKQQQSSSIKMKSQQQKDKRSTQVIPQSFDSTTAWPKCSTLIKSIYNQKDCGSCWAWSAKKALESRFCVATNKSTVLSAFQMISCFYDNNGCDGGFLDTVWSEIHSKGVVSDNCFPITYDAQPCKITCPPSTKRYKVKEFFPVSIVSNDRQEIVKAIQQEIMENGPVQASFWVFTDLLKYQGGVYELTRSGQVEGGHAIVISGWKEINGIPVWIIDNSWSDAWGDKGRFYIRRGINSCGIEDEVTAGIPNTDFN